MSKFVTTLKQEIARLGRKEAKRAVVPLKPRIAALEKLVREQRVLIQKLAKQVAGAARASAASARVAASAVVGGGDETDGVRLSPASIKRQRLRLRLSQSEFGRLTGVTPVAVYFWESGRTKPKGATRKAIVELRSVGVREAQRRLESSPEKTPKRRGKRAASAKRKKKATTRRKRRA